MIGIHHVNDVALLDTRVWFLSHDLCIFVSLYLWGFWRQLQTIPHNSGLEDGMGIN